MGLLLKTAISFVIAKTVFFFTSCSTDRLSRMLCCTELVGSGKVNKTGFRSLSRYKTFILLFFLWRLAPFRVMASLYKASRSRSLDVPQSVGLPWTSDQLDAETSA